MQDKQETSKLYPWQLPRLPLCWRDLTMHWYCTRLKVCLFKTYQLQMMKRNSSYVSNLGRNDPLEIIQLFLKWGIQFKLVKVSSDNQQRLAARPPNLYTHLAMARIYIDVVGTPLTGRRNAMLINQINFYFSKTYQFLMKGDQRKPQ